jgi:hypothetical protein
MRLNLRYIKSLKMAAKKGGQQVEPTAEPSTSYGGAVRVLSVERLLREDGTNSGQISAQSSGRSACLDTPKADSI